MVVDIVVFVAPLVIVAVQTRKRGDWSEDSEAGMLSGCFFGQSPVHPFR